MQQKEKRPDWDNYYLTMLEHISSRATCSRGRCGCAITKDNRLLASGYVGAPPGLPHCDEEDHLIKKVIDENEQIKHHCTRTVHAEQNAICQAAKFGIALDGATLYSTMEPCRVCAMLIISVGIKRVVCLKRYQAGEETRELFKKAEIELQVRSEELIEYERDS